MTEKLYENDSYIREFDAAVLDCVPTQKIFGKNLSAEWEKTGSQKSGQETAEREKAEQKNPGSQLWAVELDRTAFFPEGGGQNADTGWLEDGRVYDVQIKEDRIWHCTDVKRRPGEKVHGRIHWENRFSNMQQHSGEHIFSGLVHRYFGYDNVGFHLGSQAVTMNFNGVLRPEDIYRIETEVNGVIAQNAPIYVSYPDKEALKDLEYRSKIEILGQVRLITVEGYDVCACCAPHVAHTGEIGLLKVTDFEKYKGGTRVSILCGFRALENYRRTMDELRGISRLLSAPFGSVAVSVVHKLEELDELKQKNVELTGRLIEKDIEGIPEDQENVWFFKEAMEMPTMRRVVNLALEKVDGYGGIFCGNDADGYKYSIGTKTKDARTLASALKETLGARGGGSAQMVQGAVAASREAIQNVLDGAAL